MRPSTLLRRNDRHASPEGALFYATPKRHTKVTFDDELRSLTEVTAYQLAHVLARRATPPPTTKTSRCPGCSLIELCRPRAMTRSSVRWRSSALDALLTDAEGA